MAPRRTSVFINCPFDPDFQPIFEAIVFAVLRSGFTPRCALETDDASETRFAKIQKIVEECRYGIHDISRTETSGAPPLPRFNMPLELGLFLGAKRYGDTVQGRKRVLILDHERYRYQRFISDIAGQDIHSHGGDPAVAIGVVTAWLRSQSGRSTIPGGKRVCWEFEQFRAELPGTLQAAHLQADEMTFVDFVAIASAYIDTE